MTAKKTGMAENQGGEVKLKGRGEEVSDKVSLDRLERISRGQRKVKSTS